MGNHRAIAADLSEALDQAKAAFTARYPESAKLHAAARQHLPGGNTRSVLSYEPFPIAMARGADCRLWDVDGHEYLDLCGEYSAGLFGHSESRILDKVKDALDNGISLAAVGAAEGQLAKQLCGRFPSLDMVRFCNSGTEANLLALSAARVFTGRQVIMAFGGGYHGGVLLFPAEGTFPLTVPFPAITGKYNDADGAVAAIREVGAELAAVIVEPMLGSGGCLPGTPEFLGALRDATNEVGALLIFDEVMTSRMSDGGMQKRLGITPDMTTIGKYVAGGMSFGAFGGRADIMDLFSAKLPHAGTFNNNVLSMAAGNVAMGEIYTAAVADAHFERGEKMRLALNSRLADRQLGAHFSGLGSLAAIQFRRGPLSQPYVQTEEEKMAKDLFFLEMVERGYYLANRGMVALSLPVSDDQIAGFIDAVDDFAERHAWLIAPLADLSS